MTVNNILQSLPSDYLKDLIVHHFLIRNRICKPQPDCIQKPILIQTSKKINHCAMQRIFLTEQSRDEAALHSQKANLRIFLAQPSKSLVTNHMYGCEPQLTKMHIHADPGQQMQMVQDSAPQREENISKMTFRFAIFSPNNVTKLPPPQVYSQDMCIINRVT